MLYQDDYEYELPTDDDICIGWYQGTGWYVAGATAEGNDIRGCVNFPTYREAVAYALEIETAEGVSTWHEQDGGGLITDGGPLDLHEEYRNGWEGEDY